MPTLFFLHIPKCAGMTLTELLLERLPAGTVYQSTSMIRNHRENRPEFLEIPLPHNLKAVVGHWLHESMMPPLQRPLYLATSLRHPVDRVRSQYRFDAGLRGGDWPKPDTTTFLKQNSNVIVNFLTRAFPSIASDYEDQITAAKAILTGLDCVFDISEADEGILRLLRIAGVAEGGIRRVNESSEVDASLDVDDALIAESCQKDLALYEWFTSTRSDRARPSNRVFDPGMRTRFAELIRQPFDAGQVQRYLAPKFATELHYGTRDTAGVFASLLQKKTFAEGVMASLAALGQSDTDRSSEQSK